MTKNIDYAKVLNFIKEQNPDVMVLLETDTDWVNVLDELKMVYPYSIIRPSDDNFGISFFSKYVIKSSEVIDFSGVNTPSIWAEIDINGCILGILGTHTTPPAGEFLYQCRNRHLKKMADFIKNKKNPLVVTGDLNIAPWVGYFRDFKKTAGIKDCRRGSGICPTWGAHFYPMLIPIDYCLCSKEISVINFAIGPNIGSDHFPVITEVEIPFYQKPVNGSNHP